MCLLILILVLTPVSWAGSNLSTLTQYAASSLIIIHILSLHVILSQTETTLIDLDKWQAFIQLSFLVLFYNHINVILWLWYYGNHGLRQPQKLSNINKNYRFLQPTWLHPSSSHPHTRCPSFLRRWQTSRSSSRPRRSCCCRGSSRSSAEDGTCLGCQGCQVDGKDKQRNLGEA